MRLPKDMRGKDVMDGRQMRCATRQLRDELALNETLKSEFTKAQLKAIDAGKARIPGHTWHHFENGSLLQLVNRKLHSKVGHDGGRKKVGGRC